MINLLKSLIERIKNDEMHIEDIESLRGTRERPESPDNYKEYEPTEEITITINAIERGRDALV